MHQNKIGGGKKTCILYSAITKENFHFKNINSKNLSNWLYLIFFNWSNKKISNQLNMKWRGDRGNSIPKICSNQSLDYFY